MAKANWIQPKEKREIKFLFEQIGSEREIALMFNRDVSTIRKLLKPKCMVRRFFNVESYLKSTVTI